MSQTAQSLARLRRPRLLIRAARFGLAGYQRAHLPRLIGREPGCAAGGPLPEPIFRRLLEAETEQDAARRSGAASYSIADHVCLLTALMAEARLARTEDAAA